MSAPAEDDLPVVRVSIARDPALVRTVRLVAAAVARRAGHPEEFVEEVRLAAGEACALFVRGTNGRPDPAAPDRQGGAPVTVALSLGSRLSVEVSTVGAVEVVDHPDSDLDGIQPWALLRGLVGDVDIRRDGEVTTATLRWPVG